MIEQPGLADKLQKVNEATEKLTQMTLDAAEQGRPIDCVEQDLWSGLMQLGAQLLGCVFTQLGHGDVGPEISREGQKPLQRSDQPHRRRYRSVFGVFELHRYVYAEQRKRPAECIPFDEQIALPSHDYSLLLEKWVGADACKESFEEAVSTLERMLGSRIPVDSAERVCRRQGEMVDEFFDQLPTPPADEEGQILVETIDRKGVPICRREAEPTEPAPLFGPNEQKGPKPGTKKMAAVGSVYSVDRYYRDADTVLAALFRRRKEADRAKSPDKRPRPQHRRMQSLLPVTAEDSGEPATIDPLAAVCGWMSQQIDDRKDAAEELVLLCDGEESLWETEAIFRGESAEVTEVLDLLHAVPRIWKCAEHLHGEEPIERFVYPRLRWLLEGKAGSVIRGFRRMASVRELTGKARREVDTACAYLEKHLSRMRYDQYLARGLPIATGVIEGACRHLVKDRFERSGMRWTIEGAQSILNLRSIKTSGLSQEYYAYYRYHRLAERYGETRMNYADQFQLAA